MGASGRPQHTGLLTGLNGAASNRTSPVPRRRQESRFVAAPAIGNLLLLRWLVKLKEK